MARLLALAASGAVGFIDWLDATVFLCPIAPAIRPQAIPEHRQATGYQ